MMLHKKHKEKTIPRHPSGMPPPLLKGELNNLFGEFYFHNQPCLSSFLRFIFV